MPTSPRQRTPPLQNNFLPHQVSRSHAGFISSSMILESLYHGRAVTSTIVTVQEIARPLNLLAPSSTPNFISAHAIQCHGSQSKKSLPTPWEWATSCRRSPDFDMPERRVLSR